MIAQFGVHSPEVGRFLAQDPLGLAAGINLDAYVGNNPLRFNDPRGQIVPQLIGGVVGGAAAAVSLKLANPGATGSEILAAAGVGFVGGFLVATPVAGLVAPVFGEVGSVLAVGSAVSGASNAFTQAAVKGASNVNIVETGTFAGLGAFASIPSAAAATVGISNAAAVGLTIAQAPKAVALDLLGGALVNEAPSFTVGELVEALSVSQTSSGLETFPGPADDVLAYPSSMPNLDALASPYQK